MIAKIAYLTSPSPNKFFLHFMPEDGTSTFQIEISKAHLANIIIDGASFSLREQYQPRSRPSQESAENEHDRRQQPA